MIEQPDNQKPPDEWSDEHNCLFTAAVLNGELPGSRPTKRYGVSPLESARRLTG